MTQEEKNLLLQDLCARLPYKVIVETRYNLYEGYGKEAHIVGEKIRDGLLIGMGDRENLIISFEDYNWESFSPESIKPYLRPLSTMTEEEKKEVSILLNYEFYIDDDCALVAEDDRHRIRLDLMQVYIDWLNAHYFDFYGLISMGLAIEAPKGMYKNKDIIYEM